MDILALVLARAGSTRLPGKNLMQVGGKSLTARACLAGREVPYVSRVVCSTDSEEIAAEARAHGAETPFLRPPELALSTASATDAELHALQWLADNEGYRPDALCRLQPTSPLRGSGDVARCCVRLINGRPAVVSVCTVEDHEWLQARVTESGRLAMIHTDDMWKRPSQYYPKRVRPNGAVYVAEVDYFKDHNGYFGPKTYTLEMPRWRSVDVDTMDDLELARMYAEKLEAA